MGATPWEIQSAGNLNTGGMWGLPPGRCPALRVSLRCIELLIPVFLRLVINDDQVIAAAQWVLPQVDIYIGELSPFGASINFTAGSSRSNAVGKCIFRHSKRNGGATFGVVDEPADGDEGTCDEQDEVQVDLWWLLHNIRSIDWFNELSHDRYPSKASRTSTLRRMKSSPEQYRNAPE